MERKSITNMSNVTSDTYHANIKCSNDFESFLQSSCIFFFKQCGVARQRSYLFTEVQSITDKVVLQQLTQELGHIVFLEAFGSATTCIASEAWQQPKHFQLLSRALNKRAVIRLFKVRQSTF